MGTLYCQYPSIIKEQPHSRQARGDLGRSELVAGAVITRIGGNSLYNGGVYHKEDWENLSKRLSFRQFHIDGGEFLKFAYKIKGQHHNWCGDYGKNWFQCNIR